MATILDLTTLAPERAQIAIDGHGYELALLDDFGLLELARVQRLQSIVADIMARANDPTDEDVAALEQALDGFVALVLPGLPADVRGRLRDKQKLAIVRAFQQAAGTLGENPPQKTAPIGVK